MMKSSQNSTSFSRRRFPSQFNQPTQTEIWAHRGFSSRFPENTLPAFEAALEIGVDGLELDIHRSKDGHIVVMHDYQVRRTTNASGYIFELTLDELKSLDAGQWKGRHFIGYEIPTLAEVLSLVSHWNSPVTLNIESKSGRITYPDLESDAWQLVKEYHMEHQTVLSSFNHLALQQFKQTCPDASVAPLYWEGLVDSWLYAERLGAPAVHPFKNAFNHEVVKACHQHGIRVHAFGVDDVRTARRLIAWGVDALITNHPDVLLGIQARP
ncbi:glycerophosphodiester phosphodiesterase [Alicyclobacillus sp. SO9]|uniref:glycerophosphodiester phosphodiesterase n=1 Tax=Alicyclobacillus sp. SO9 TaxID=2665646 RepID=UPI0018E8C322|nr:glycerophosphodiester phosphodiesterase [Alicyclobacillus sp. SO9]QQE79908.1 glycerophosphodiester phosphodiesterase [Alicyclobacillus sp. SO9]